MPAERVEGRRLLDRGEERRLEEVVRRGTAARTGLGRFRAAGKTGTGDLPRGKEKLRNVAWFAGYAPAEAPTIAFACCFVDVEGYGGDVAAGASCEGIARQPNSVGSVTRGR